MLSRIEKYMPILIFLLSYLAQRSIIKKHAYLFQTCAEHAAKDVWYFNLMRNAPHKNTQLPDYRGFTPGCKDYAPLGRVPKTVFRNYVSRVMRQNEDRQQSQAMLSSRYIFVSLCIS